MKIIFAAILIYLLCSCQKSEVYLDVDSIKEISNLNDIKVDNSQVVALYTITNYKYLFYSDSVYYEEPMRMPNKLNILTILKNYPNLKTLSLYINGSYQLNSYIQNCPKSIENLFLFTDNISTITIDHNFNHFKNLKSLYIVSVDNTRPSNIYIKDSFHNTSINSLLLDCSTKIQIDSLAYSFPKLSHLSINTDRIIIANLPSDIKYMYLSYMYISFNTFKSEKRVKINKLFVENLESCNIGRRDFGLCQLIDLEIDTLCILDSYYLNYLDLDTLNAKNIQVASSVKERLNVSSKYEDINYYQHPVLWHTIPNKTKKIQ